MQMWSYLRIGLTLYAVCVLPLVAPTAHAISCVWGEGDYGFMSCDGRTCTFAFAAVQEHVSSTGPCPTAVYTIKEDAEIRQIFDRRMADPQFQAQVAALNGAFVFQSRPLLPEKPEHFETSARMVLGSTYGQLELGRLADDLHTVQRQIEAHSKQVRESAQWQLWVSVGLGLVTVAGLLWTIVAHEPELQFLFAILAGGQAITDAAYWSGFTLPFLSLFLLGLVTFPWSLRMARKKHAAKMARTAHADNDKR